MISCQAGYGMVNEARWRPGVANPMKSLSDPSSKVAAFALPPRSATL